MREQQPVTVRNGTDPVGRTPTMPPQAFVFRHCPTSETPVEISQRGVKRRWVITAVRCSAAAGWKCTEQVLVEKQPLGFVYNSDCRGENIFCPVVDGEHLTPQIPVTLPTYDELIGRHDISDTNYNRYLLSLIRPRGLNVLAVHAEVEGIARAPLFADLLESVASSGVSLVPLGSLLQDSPTPEGAIAMAPIHGREGTVCRQVA